MGALGWASDRLGRRAYLMLTTGLFGAGIAGLALSDSFVALLLTLVVLYSFSGLYDVGINAVSSLWLRVAGSTGTMVSPIWASCKRTLRAVSDPANTPPVRNTRHASASS
jgi:MFS family permease